MAFDAIFYSPDDKINQSQLGLKGSPAEKQPGVQSQVSLKSASPAAVEQVNKSQVSLKAPATEEGLMSVTTDPTQDTPNPGTADSPAETNPENASPNAVMAPSVDVNANPEPAVNLDVATDSGAVIDTVPDGNVWEANIVT